MTVHVARRLTLTPAQRRALGHGVVVAGLLFAGYLFVVAAPAAGTVGLDAIAYWSFDPANPYRLAEGTSGAFTYPPTMALLFSLGHALSWPAFWLLWTALLVGTVIWLGWRRTLLLIAFPPIAIELYFGNVNLLLAAAMALGFRYPAAWAFVLVSKVTPGIGLIWFAVRREWRNLVIALGVAAVATVASLVVAPDLWRQWLTAVVFAGGAPDGFLPIPLVVRLPLAAALVWWGAATDRRWTVPVGATLALPALWLGGLATLAALAAIDRPELREIRTPARAGEGRDGLRPDRPRPGGLRRIGRMLDRRPSTPVVEP